MESKNQYYDCKRYEVLENKSMIHIFKKTIFGNLKWWKGVSKEYFTWVEDGEMFIVTETNASNSNSSSAKADSFNKDLTENQK